jgi:uncharacterized membrane protein YbhN (UPF0104 family)
MAGLRANLHAQLRLPPSVVGTSMKPSRNVILAAAALTAALLAVAFVPQLLGSEVRKALNGLGGARPIWLWAAGACFVGTLVGSAGAYRSAFGLVGGRYSPLDAAARFGIGSLVNSFAPLRLGDAVRLALFSRRLESEERLWTTGGVVASLAAARAFVTALVITGGALAGALPLWPVLICLTLVAVAGSVAWATRNRSASKRVAHLLDAFRALGREPGHAARITGWIAFSALARLAAASAIAVALGVHRPIGAAVMVVAALDLAGVLPLTPGNVGITSGAVAVALNAHGVPMTIALTTGIAFHAVETCAGVSSGLASALYLVEVSPARRWAVVAVAGAAAVALVGAFSMTVLVNVV